MKLKQEYGLDSFTLNDLVEQALDFFRKNPNPIVKEIDEFKIKESVNEESVAVKQEDLQEGSSPIEAAQDEKMPSEAQKSTVLRDNPMFRRSGPIAAENEDDVISEASEIEEELTQEEDFRQCGEKIQNCLFDGAEIPDQLYVDLYIAKLRMNYEYKDKKALG